MLSESVPFDRRRRTDERVRGRGWRSPRRRESADPNHIRSPARVSRTALRTDLTPLQYLDDPRDHDDTATLRSPLKCGPDDDVDDDDPFRKRANATNTYEFRSQGKSRWSYRCLTLPFPL